MSLDPREIRRGGRGLAARCRIRSAGRTTGRQLTEILGWLASAALWGPTSASEGIRRCADYLDEIGNHPRGQAVILKHMAGLYAMQDEVETAHATLSRAKSYLDTLGPTMTAAVTQPAAFIAMLAGDPATAEMHLRFAYESLSLMGEKGNLGHRGGATGQSHRGAGRERGTTKPAS